MSVTLARPAVTTASAVSRTLEATEQKGSRFREIVDTQIRGIVPGFLGEEFFTSTTKENPIPAICTPIHHLNSYTGKTVKPSDLISSGRLIYINYVNGEIADIGVHPTWITKIKSIKAFTLAIHASVEDVYVRVKVGYKITPMTEVSYARMVKGFEPALNFCCIKP